MKRTDLISQIESLGARLIRHGANHDIYSNGDHMEPIPRHKEIKEPVAKAILKRFGAK